MVLPHLTDHSQSNSGHCSKSTAKCIKHRLCFVCKCIKGTCDNSVLKVYDFVMYHFTLKWNITCHCAVIIS